MRFFWSVLTRVCWMWCNFVVSLLGWGDLLLRIFLVFWVKFGFCELGGLWKFDFWMLVCKVIELFVLESWEKIRFDNHCVVCRFSTILKKLIVAFRKKIKKEIIFKFKCLLKLNFITNILTFKFTLYNPIIFYLTINISEP